MSNEETVAYFYRNLFSQVVVVVLTWLVLDEVAFYGRRQWRADKARSFHFRLLTWRSVLGSFQIFCAQKVLILSKTRPRTLAQRCVTLEGI